MNTVVMDNDQSASNYISLYGLSEPAFSQKLIDKFFYLGTEQAEYLSLLHNLIQDQNLVLHISGVSGVGKSSLINRFVNIGEEDWRFSVFNGNAMMNSEQLIFNILTGFGLNGLNGTVESYNNLKDTCIKNIAQLEKSGVTPILVIDDVQELPFETLRTVFELINRWDNKHPKLRIILISNPQFFKILNSEEIKPLCKYISHHLEINPLTEEQVERYIYFRLTVAGLDGRNPINTESCVVISNKSKGIPEEINNLCHLALRDGMEEMSMKEFFDDHNFTFPIRKYLLTGSLMSIFLGVLFSVVEPFDWSRYQENLATKIQSNDSKNIKTAISDTSVLAYLKEQHINAIEDGEDDIDITLVTQYDFTQFKFLSELEAKNRKKIVNLVQTQYNDKRHTKKLVKKQKYNKNARISSLKDSVNVAVTEDIKSKKGDIKNYNIQKLTTIKNKKFPELLSIVPIKNLSVLRGKNQDIVQSRSDKSEKIIRLYGLWFGEKNKITIYGSAGVTELPDEQVTYISDSQINIKITPGNYVGKHWIVITDPENGKSNSKLLELNNSLGDESDALDTKLVEDEQWILAQQSDLYILHVLGSIDKTEIINFAHTEAMGAQFAIFETNRNGIEWYHLILGTYKDREDAKLAVQHLPDRIKLPWIRSIKDIQKVIMHTKLKTVLNR